MIEQAKTAMASRFGITTHESFELMRGLARSQNRSLHEFAAEVLANDGKTRVAAPERARAQPRAPARSRISTISGEALAAGMGERGHPAAVREIDVGACGDELPHDLGVLGAAVAEDDRLEERRPAEPVDVVDLDRGLEQAADDLA